MNKKTIEKIKIARGVFYFLLLVVSIILALDLLAFGFWVYYEQVPTGDIYAGKITVEIIKLFLNI